MFHVRRSGDAAVVEITGEIDFSSSKPLGEILASADVVSATNVVVSLLECTYLDSSCIASLVGAQKRLEKRLAVVVRPGTIPAKILHLASLGTFFRLSDNLEAALAA
jgi:anti-anti-sigma factor